MIQFHDLANLFPMIDDAGFPEFAADIKAHGLVDRIVILDGMILDGRNRYRALVLNDAVDVEADADEMIAAGYAVAYAHDEDPLDWVLSKNLRRRHLNDSQRAMIADKLATLKVGRPAEWRTGLKAATGDNSANLRHSEPMTQAQAAQALNVSERSVQTARQVREHGVPELVERVERGRVSVSAAAAVAELPIAEQEEIVRSVDPRAFSRVARERREERQAEKREQRDSRAADLAGRQRALPVGLNAGIVYCDPAWDDPERYSDVTGMDRAAENHYPTMTLSEIMDLDVDGVAARDCILFMWCKANNVVEAICVAAAWGFAVFGQDEAGRIVPDRRGARYASQVVWDKVHFGNGRWVRDQHEILMIFRRGNPVAPAPGTQVPSVLSAKRTEHSAKPDAILNWIDSCWPDAIKIELNRRGPARDGWHAWGNEAVEEAAGLEETPAHEAPDAGGEVTATPPAPDQALVDADVEEQEQIEIPEPLPPDGAASTSQGGAVAGEDRAAASSPVDINQIIRDGYAADMPVAELATLTGLKPAAVMKRASRMGLGSRDRQRRMASAYTAGQHARGEFSRSSEGAADGQRAD